MKVLSIGAHALSGAAAVRTLHSLLTPAEVQNRPGQAGVVVVISELSGVRERLVSAARSAEGGGDYQEQIDAIRTQHLSVIRELFPAPRQSAVITPLQILLGDLEDILHGVQLLRECSPRTVDLALSFGVRAACGLVARYLESRGLQVQVVEDPGIKLRSADPIQGISGSAGGPLLSAPTGHEVADYPGSLEAIRASLRHHAAAEVTVVGAGIGGAAGGVPIMLKRDGGDLSAALIGAALGAELIELWTNRDGVTSADSAFVDSAFVLAEISYQEAMELSYFGARLVHPTALVPAMEAGIPIRIRNLAHPQGPGTLIRRRQTAGGPADGARVSAVTGIASIEPAALINVEGGGMIGVPGIAARIFGALARAGVNIIMISQASSEHSICVVFRKEEGAAALAALQNELAGEIRAKLIQSFDMKENLAILAVIGENMRGTPGISGRLFSALGREGINILAIAQGSSETNISFVIDRDDEARALQTIHRAFLEGSAVNGTGS